MQDTAVDILQVFRRDELQLFIAAASITVAFVTIGCLFIRRRFDRLLSLFAWFAFFYGTRLWMQSTIYGLMAHSSHSLNKGQFALNFFVSVPAFLFFDASELVGRAGRVIANVVCLVAVCLVGAILLGFPLPLLDKINSIVVIAGSISIVILTIYRPMTDKGGRVFRAGLIIFVSFVIWTNGAELLGHRTTVELYGFTAFLCCFGYIVAGRVLDRDQQLTSIKQELEIARRIQLSILPDEFPAFEDFAVAVRYAPMTSVAGDFYEFIYSETKGLGLLIADVSGHGVPAALIASMIKVAIQSQRHSMKNPDQVLTGVNQALCGNTQNQFITAAYVHLDKECGEFHYAAAGHPPMLLLRAGQTSQILENGLVLALMPSAVYTSTSQSLLIGDRLLLYTDGIIEATKADGEEFGYERLRNLLQLSESESTEDTASMILGAVNDWSPSQSDDLTIIVCDYKRICDDERRNPSQSL